jgi:cobalt-zinc-cadmium efflux system membrane fusion protein
MNTFLRLLACGLLITSTGISCSQEGPTESSGSSEQPEQATTISAATPSGAPQSKGQITTATVAVGPSNPVLSLAGKVSYGEDRYSKVSSALEGRVQKIHAKLGDFVQAGGLLVTIESPEIASAYSEFIKEHSDLSYANRAYELAKDLYDIKALPQKDLKQAENDFIKAKAEFRRARERLLSLQVPKEELEKPLSQQTITSSYQIYSPIAGTVVERTVTPGQSVNGDPTQVLFTVADLSKIQVIADVYEKDLGLVEVNQKATVTVEAYPDIGFPATISAIGDLVDPTTRTIKLRAVVNNADHKLKPGMFARLNVRLSQETTFPLIPQDAVVEIDGSMFVYVAEGNNRYVKRPVKIGLPSAGQVAVLDGLKAGETIVVKGAVLLKGQDMNQEEGGSSTQSPSPAHPTKP